MYCALCARPVEAKRQIGVGTAVLAVLSGGLWLLAIPFYSKRCSICRSAAVSATPPPGATRGTPFERLGQLEKRLSLAEGELETANVEIERLKAEQDFYRKLLESPASRESAARPPARGPGPGDEN
jgi:hypothetical protein